jgi:PAS domain S-box-containing protein
VSSLPPSDSEVAELVAKIQLLEHIAIKCRGVREKTELIRLVQQEFSKSGDAMAVFMLTGDGKKITLGQNTIDPKILGFFETRSGQKIEGRASLEKSPLFQQVIREGKTLHVEMRRLLEEYFQIKAGGIHNESIAHLEPSVIATPLHEGETLVGMLLISSPSLGEFFVPFVESFATQLANAIQLLELEKKRRIFNEELEESESKYRALMENASDAIILFDLRGNIIEANRRTEELLECRRSELVGRNIVQLASKDEIERAVDVFKKAMGADTASILNINMLRKNGTIALVDMTGSKIQYKNKTVVQCILRDITERKKWEESLWESEEKFREGLHASPNPLLLTDVNGNVLDFNMAALVSYGRSEKENLIGKNAIELIGKKDQSKLTEDLRKLQKTGTMNGAEYTFTGKDGTERLLELSASTIRDLSGKPKFFVIMTRDVSNLRRMETDLREYESRYRTLFENSPIALIEEDFSGVRNYINRLKSSGVKDFDAYFQKHPEEICKCADLVRVVDMNDTAMKLLGINSKDIMKNGISQFFVDEGIWRFKNEIVALSEGRLFYESTGKNMKLNGEPIYTLLRWSVVSGYQSDCSKVFVSLIDISERNRVWEALKGSEERQRAIFETAANLIICVNEDGLIVDCNGRVQEYLGYSPVELIGQPMVKIVHPDHLAGIRASIAEVLKKGFVYNYECRFTRRDGSFIDINSNSSALKNKDGNNDRALLIISDITQSKKAHEFLTWELTVNTLLGKLYEFLISGQPLTKIAQQILDQAKFMTSSEGGFVSTLEPTSGRSLLQAFSECPQMEKVNEDEVRDQSKDTEVMEDPQGAILCHSKLDRVLHSLSLASETGLYTNALDSTPLAKDMPEELGKVRRVLYVPVKIHEELAGQIVMIDSGRDYADRDLDAVRRMGEFFALAIRRKRIEDALEESEDKYRRLVEHSTDGVVIQQEGRVVYINAAGAKMVGVDDPSKVLGKSLKIDFLHPDYEAFLQESAAKTSRICQPLLERKFTRLDGKVIDIEVTAVPFLYKGQSAFQVIFRDITHRKKMEEALRHSEEKYRQLVQLAYEGIWVFDADYKTTYVNQRMAEMLGYSPERIIKRSLFEFMDYQGRTVAEGKLDLEKHGVRERHDIEFIRSDGSKMYAMLSTSPMVDAAGKCTGAIAVVTDITERRLMEEGLRSEKEKLELITSNIGIGVAVISRDRKVLWANSVLKSQFGNLEKKYCFLMHNQNGSICTNCGMDEVFAGRTLHTHEQCSMGLANEKSWSEIVTTPIRNSRGEVVLVLEIVVPVTERKRMELLLQESETRYRLLFENMPDGIYQSTEDGRLVTVNSALVEMLGYGSKEELMQLNIDRDIYVKPEERAKSIKKLKRMGELRNLKNELKRKDGRSIRVLENSHAVRDMDGAILYFEGIFKEIPAKSQSGRVKIENLMVGALSQE